MIDPAIGLTTVERLLLSLCRLDFSGEQKAEIRSLVKEIRDWDQFVDLSNKHGVIALCWYNLTETGNSNNIPAKQLEILHSAYLKNLTRNSFLYNQLKDIVIISEKENIKIVLLKGIALEKTLYKNIGLRQMGDIDILVRQDDAALLRRILLKNGFKSAPLISSFHEEIMPAYGKHLPEMYKNGIAVEIHFKLFNQKGNSLTEEFFNKATRLSGNEETVYYPDPQLFFLYLVKHLEKHETSGIFQLRLYTDLIVLLSLYFDQIINYRLFESALSANLENTLAKKLMLLNLYWGITLPDKVKSIAERIRSQQPEVDFIRFFRQPYDEEKEENESFLNLLKDVPGRINRLLLIIGHIFPSLRYMKYRYKTETVAGAILHYPVRWTNQIKKILSGKL